VAAGRSGRTLGFLCAGLVLAGAPTVAAAAAPTDEAAQRAIHLLDYVAVDYAGAVRDGAIASESEYAEQLEFAGQLRVQLERLGVGADDPLARSLADLDAALHARAPADQVASRARALGAGLRERFHVPSLPPRAPSIERSIFAMPCSWSSETAALAWRSTWPTNRLP